MQPVYKRVMSFDEDAKAKLLEGAEIVYKAVSATLGPKSGLVAIDHPFGNPETIGDGVRTAKAVIEQEFEDREIGVGAKLLSLAAQKTNDQVGDGTTTSTILAYEIVKAAHEAIENGANAMILRKGIQKAVDDVCEYLDSIKKPVTDKQIKQVATVSAQNEALGELIADAFERLGKDGVITVEETGRTETMLEFKEGMEFDKGFLSGYFITNPESNEATVVEPYILVTDQKLNNAQDIKQLLINFLESVDQAARNLVIICNGAEPAVLATLVAQKLQGVMNILAVQAPGNGESQRDILQDVATSVGGRLITKETHQNLANVVPKSEKGITDLTALGRADHVTASDKTTVIVDGQSSEEDLKARVRLLTDQRDHPDVSAFDKEKLTERLAKLTSGIGIINIGGHNEAEISEMRERAIDAVEATKAALEDGVVAGGEMGLLNAANVVDADLKGDEALGYEIVIESCLKPFEKLMDNSHIERSKLYRPDSTNKGIDVISGEEVDLIKEGILDPVKVPKTALVNAAAAAMQILSTSVIVGLKEADYEKTPTD